MDVAAVGFGKKELLIKNRAKSGDRVVLLGGPTGRDGMGGAQFASDRLESEDRSAVQIPDPFIEKMIIEAVLEARREGLLHAVKDLGGGGLSCAISETADALSIGISMDVSKVHTRGAKMLPHEIMVSESQERMLIITPNSKLKRLQEICEKFGVACSDIGKVTSDGLMHVKNGSKTVVKIRAKTVANAPLLDLPSSRPKYLDNLPDGSDILTPANLSKHLQTLLSSPNIASKEPVYAQYDHEVGIRTIVRPDNTTVFPCLPGHTRPTNPFCHAFCALSTISFTAGPMRFLSRSNDIILPPNSPITAYSDFLFSRYSRIRFRSDLGTARRYLE